MSSSNIEQHLKTPSSPSNRTYNLGYKTASATYERLQCGLGKQLTNHRIDHYRRLGYYGERERRLADAEQAARQARNSKVKTSSKQVASIVNDLMD